MSTKKQKGCLKLLNGLATLPIINRQRYHLPVDIETRAQIPGYAGDVVALALIKDLYHRVWRESVDPGAGHAFMLRRRRIIVGRFCVLAVPGHP